MKIDLHMHSTFSDDGEFTPEELVDLAVREGVGCISLTDHNATGGVDAAIEAGKGAGVTVIPGVELDCRYRDLVLHILGYYINHRDRRYQWLREHIWEEEKAAGMRRLGFASQLGLALDVPELLAAADNSGGVITPELVAEFALMHPDNAEAEILLPYRPGGDRADNPFVNFYWDHCSPGKPGFVPIDFLTLESGVELIRSTGGVAVLAHPGAYLKGREDELPVIMQAGVSGVEVYSGYHDAAARKHWAEACFNREIDLLTCGSDFHGKTKPSIRLGAHGDPRGEQARSDVAAHVPKPAKAPRSSF